MLFNLAQSYVDAINKGAVPSIENSWSYICKNECHNANQDAFSNFESTFYRAFEKAVPMFEEELKSLYSSAKKTALEIFNKIAVGDVREEYLKNLKEKMQTKLEYFRLENEKTSEQQCMMFLEQEYEPIAQRLRNQEY